ncbi:AraC family transcriptional regulator [Trinickia caryophylli]|uniref:Transcriptional regulator, AraC family n=1 Tax=Trinickia caryophylli TaxID=28094 RepID=A0A1X7CN96_TRICW|nr:AraC family transcriptional regulator [Trinickia caryophylli]PMS11229.1 AraC family transcriptional regulator [Trinickia caryophylli]TRX20085.1 AraC family transcriptional regulator [Trinickia caryophylli]WQE12566.1 AraC family transcriptional regulator [Trinickia caryophylli]SME99632.1 transcriptional regulator, AraC family [Trinickia caryophylli]GLU30256.1 transcriptional regulator [Trinickia caryophylli]
MHTSAVNANQGIDAVRHDLEGAREWMVSICGPHGLRARSPKKLQFHHSGTVLRSMASTLGYVEYGTDVTVSVHNETPLNCYSVSLPLTGYQELSARGRLWVSDQDRSLVLSPHERQDLTIMGNCRKIIVAIQGQALRQVLEGLLQRPLHAPVTFEPQMNAADGDQAAWWRMVRFLLTEMGQAARLLDHQQMAGNLEQALIKGLLLCQPHNYSQALAGAVDSSCPHYLLRAKQFIQDNAREDVALEDIERAAGVSRYKLFEGFRQHFGLAPMAYLKRHRLEAVRREMLSDGSERNVSSIAMNWGFSHLGRFSSDYKLRFGETPSQTLKRAATR